MRILYWHRAMLTFATSKCDGDTAAVLVIYGEQKHEVYLTGC
jgi:hypothetical protein